MCEACGWGNSNGTMQPWRGRYLHISPSFTCPLNKVNRTNSHWRYWYTADHQQIISANPAADIWTYFHADKSKRIINLNSNAANIGEETCKSLVLFHTLTGPTFVLEHTYKIYPISIHSEICKNHRCHKLCVPNSFKAVANYVCKLYREVKLIRTMLII